MTDLFASASEETPAPASRGRNLRRRAPTLFFDAAGYVEGWAFLVHSAFRPALDIAYTSRIQTEKAQDGQPVKRRTQAWTEGNPPSYAFLPTDLLPSREIVAGFIPPRPDAAPLSRWIAQVAHATPDTREGKIILPGSVDFRLFEWQGGQSGRYVKVAWHSCPQADFVNFLRTGPCALLDQSETLDDPAGKAAAALPHP